ncbi:transporter [Flavobacterium sp. RHBU_3]|uniref:transporter n=1 Tax=Flavobacterium sp. RHBU_3 TaxID=3391184 RepID=UPI00398474AF
MTFKTQLIFTALLALGLQANAQYTDEINSNRPGQSQSAFAVGKSVFQVETGVNGVYEKHNILNNTAKGVTTDLALRYGAFDESLEFMADMQYRFDLYEDAIYSYNRNDFSKFVLGAKYLAYDPDKNYNPKPDLKSWWANRRFKWRTLIPAVAVYGGVHVMSKGPFTFPEDKTSFKGMVILQHHFGRWVWVNNIIFDKVGTTYPSTNWITTFTHGLSKRASGFLEFQAIKSDYYADAIARVGGTYLIHEDLQVDASISGNFKDTPSVLYGGVGLSWRFDADYKDILIGGKGDREDELKAEQEKQKKEQEKHKKDRKAAREARKKELEQPMGPAEP